ncbi:DUF1549 domain-containing protein [Verrucomicrobium sp. BvORR034]|uniref:DUF1549 domain-containing protein n=1 Tax=Verrucomicrobium sp. BvORR034 TaxID=1396418 RepID=UPI0006787479|nr:DUF1549 domain-containing protein [Verrucomicrobium sp. BvORR034]
MRSNCFIRVLGPGILVVLLSVKPAVAVDSGGITFFENEVRPLLVKHCYECHSQESGKAKGGLLLDRREGWATGGDAGPAVVPGKVAESLLIASVRYEKPDLQMPPKSRLNAAEVAVLERWVAMGAPDPREAALAAATQKKQIDFVAARKTWAYREHQAEPVPVPAVKQADWPREEMDHFILARLEESGHQPAADAPARALVRRLYYDLTGLPPSPEDADDFVDSMNREGEAALTALVDRLLASASFGETWGRHWLDLARYADSNGGDRNYTYYQAWRYRNYVIDAFNADKPFYTFVKEQLAGDLLPWSTDSQRREQLVASTFLTLGPKMLTERDKEKIRLDVADEQIDTVGRAFLGLTLGCARCHDHKFDPVSQQDYYALAGIFRSTQVVMGTRNGCVNVASWVERPLPVPEPQRGELEQQVTRLELIMRLKVEKDFKQKSGGKKTLDDLPLAGVVYDEADAELTGAWKSSTLSPKRFGETYIHDDRQEKGGRQALFRGSLPESGVYEVRVAYSPGGNRSRSVPVTVEAGDGVHEIILDQTKEPTVAGLFQPVGRFEFKKGARANVMLSNRGTIGYVMVDAVQFVAVKDIAREAEVLAMSGGGTDPVFKMSAGELSKALTKQIDELKDAELAMAPRDAEDAGDCHLRIRGEVAQRGPLVARNFPQVLHSGPPPVISSGASGRLELAIWITGPQNGLLDRVMVNRLWSQLFRRGIVGTVDNFGIQGETPTHPELLEHLAQRFRSSGGSMKALIREMVLSRTYRLAAAPESKLVAVDPENRLFGRHQPRRLSAEEIRDSLLLLGGRLTLERGNATAGSYGEDLDGKIDVTKLPVRSVYLPMARNNLAADLEVFDAANPEVTVGERTPTTVPTQALYLLNSEVLQAQARELGAGAYLFDDPDAVNRLYRSVLGRLPHPAERERAVTFVRDGGADREQALADLAHVLLASTEFLFLD